MTDREIAKIKELSSEDFIAYLFYNVLGGVYAADEEEARIAIFDMIQDLHTSISQSRLEGKREGMMRAAEIICPYCARKLPLVPSRPGLHRVSKTTDGFLVERCLAQAITKEMESIKICG